MSKTDNEILARIRALRAMADRGVQAKLDPNLSEAQPNATVTEALLAARKMGELDGPTPAERH
jgi:hypothetical protein